MGLISLKNSLKIFLFLLFFLLLFPDALALDYRKHIELIENTYNCLGSCHAIIKIHDLPVDVSISSKDRLKTWYYKTEKSKDLKEFKLQIRKTETYYVDVPEVECNPYEKKTTNGTITIIDNCTTTYHKEQRTRYYYEDFNPLGKTIKANTDYYIKIVGKKEIKLGENNIDWKIKFMGFEPDWAWWNSTYNYRYEILTNGTVLNMPYSVNDTDLVNSTPYWTPHTSETTYVYCENSVCGSGLIAIANETDEKYWEKEDTLKGNNPTSVWGNNALLVNHMHNASHLDSSQYDNDGTTVGNPSISPYSNFGNTLAFDGNDGITVSSTTELDNIVDNYTVSLWANLSDTSTYAILLEKRETDGSVCASNTRVFQVFVNNPSGYFGVVVQDCAGTGHQNQTLGAVDGEWHYIVMTEVDDNFYWYYDGELRDTLTDSDHPQSDEEISIGYRRKDNGAKDSYFTGDLEELRIYNESKSATWVREQYYNYLGNFSSLGSEETSNTPPKWKNNKTSIASGSTYSSSQNYGFEVEWTDDNDNNGYNFSYFEHNFTGTSTNYTSSRSGNISYYNFTGLPVGNYNFRFYANDSSNEWNKTDQWDYSIVKATPTITISFLPSSAITVGTESEATCTLTAGDSSSSLELWRDSVSKASGTSPINETTTLGTGNYNYSCNSSSTQNYTAGWTTDNFLLVSMATQINELAKEVYKFMLLNDERKLSNDNICLDNSTLLHNITFEMDDDTDNMYIYETCQFGCDNVTHECRKAKIYEYTDYFIYLVLILIAVGVLIYLFRR